MNGWEALAEATEAEVVATPKVVEPVEELERVNEVEAQVIECPLLNLSAVSLNYRQR
jgi:hypothetical protein